MAQVKDNTLHCTFCGKSQFEVKKLIAGPMVFICDECTILCFDILVEGSFVDAQGLTDAQQLLRREHRVAELVALLETIVDAEETRSRRYTSLKSKIRKLHALRNPSKVLAKQ